MTASENIYEDFGGLIRLLNDLEGLLTALIAVSVSFYVAGLYKDQKAIDRQTAIKSEVRILFVTVVDMAEKLRNGALCGHTNCSEEEYSEQLRHFETMRRKVLLLGEVQVSKAMEEYYGYCLNSRKWWPERDLPKEDEMQQYSIIHEVNPGYDRLIQKMQDSVSSSQDPRSFH